MILIVNNYLQSLREKSRYGFVLLRGVRIENGEVSFRETLWERVLESNFGFKTKQSLIMTTTFSIKKLGTRSKTKLDKFVKDWNTKEYQNLIAELIESNDETTNKHFRKVKKEFEKWFELV